MKKRRIALVTLLVACVTFALAIMPLSAIAAEATGQALVGTALTTSHAGRVLSGDYYVEPGKTLTLRASAGVSGLKVDANKTLTIHIPADSALYVYGGAASTTTGAGAGIEVNAGSTLKITGEGALYAYGGKAANGGSGAKGDNATWGDDDYTYIPDSGYGGHGGGGAGAGIGTKGGNGGAQTSWRLGFYGGRSTWTDYFMDDNYSGSDGYTGNAGKTASSCGTIYISQAITLSATGGAAGTSGGSGGAAGASDYESDDHEMRGLAGGAGGGGGGAGKAGASVGTGGGGGGSGGSGGAVGYAWSCYFVGGGGGGGGAGAVGGSGGAWSSDSQVPDHDCGKYTGGRETVSSSGSRGGNDAGGNGGNGAKVKMRATDSTSSSWEWPHGGKGGKGGSAGANCSEVIVQKLYKVNIDIEGEVLGSYYASASDFLPESLAIPGKEGYTFIGFSANDILYYDENGVRTAAQITADTNISATFRVNSYSLNMQPSEGSSGGNSDVNGSVEYGDSITLTTPSRAGYLFRGWKISASSGTISETAYYTYTAAKPMSRMLRATPEITANFQLNGNAAQTAGFETIGDRVTLYNLSADPNAQLTIEEIWVPDSFTVTFKDFNNSVLSVQNGTYGTSLSAPALPNNQNEYYSYTFKYWKCNIDNRYYTTAELPALGAFLAYESEQGNKVYDGVTFTAVYDITEYKKELHLVGSLGNTNLNEDGVLVLNSTDTNVDVVTNFTIQKNSGVASLLLIPEYDASAFSIKAISVNGVMYEFGSTAASSAVLGGFNVKFTGNEVASDPLKILLDSVTTDATMSDEVFIQIIYVMNTAIGGGYEFGFVTKTPTTTDNATHGDRSEAYGTYDPDIGSEKDAWVFNELKITVDNSAIKVVIRATGEIVIEEGQSFVYSGTQMSAAEVSELIEKALQYSYNGFAKKTATTLTIKWYDADGNEIAAPRNAGTYQVGISAAETTYYTAAAEVKATFTITPRKIYVSAKDQDFTYTGNPMTIDVAASNGTLYMKDAEGNLIPVDDFVNGEIVLVGVTLNGSFVNVGEYVDVIRGMIQYTGSGSADNYTIVYEDGSLTITVAVNDWVIAPADKTEEYSGDRIGIDPVTADFGVVKILYLIGYEKDASGNYVLVDGERVPIWSETAPTDAGSYTVSITVDGTTNYTALSYEVTLTITKKVISADGFTFEAIDKIYNGEAQYWSLDPNGDKNKNDAEIQLIASAANASVLQYVNFAGMLHPVTCMNAGTHVIQAVLQISNPNYTFIVDDEECDTFTYDVTVRILALRIIIDTADQSAPYSGSEPSVGQGEGYVTITLADGTVVPDFVLRDFFGGEREIYTSALEYDATATYYELVDGVYTVVTLTKEQFNANKELAGEDGYKEYFTKSVVEPEDLLLTKAPGVNVGVYALSALLGGNSNYEIVTVNEGTFTITKQLVPVPSLGILIYNGATQLPAVPAGYENIYQFVGGGKDVGLYMLTAVLLDKDNYAWEDVISVNVGSLPTNVSFTVELEGRLFLMNIRDIDDYESVNFLISAGRYPYTEIAMTSDDIVLPWYIDQKTITLVFPDATESYEYGTFVNDILNALGTPTWKEGDAPYATDSMTEIHWLNVGYNGLAYPVVGTNYLTVSQGLFNTNYNVLVEGGRVDITKKILTADDLMTQIIAAIKNYTGEVLVLDTNADFTVLLYDYNTYGQEVFYVTAVDTKGYVDANGWMDADVFTYYVDEESGKLYVTVSVALTEEVKANYELADEAESFTFDVEAYIAKAENAWKDGPAVDATDIIDVKTNAAALFGNVNEVTFYTDSECLVPFVGAFQANNVYYAKFTVTGNDNYYGLETVIVFSGSHVTILKPVVRLDSESGEIVVADQEITLIYDGKVHTFLVYANDNYRVIFTPDAAWKKVGSYTVTVELADTNYVWEDGTQSVLTYTLHIDQKELTLTVDDETLTFGEDAPVYNVVANGLVEGETLESLLGDLLADYIRCDYVAGNNVGDYDISILDAIAALLSNYDVTLENGVLTVEKLAFDYDQIFSEDEKTFAELIAQGALFVYDSEAKEITVVTLPDELKITLVYKDASGNVISAPTNAGAYTVEIALAIDESEYLAGNYALPENASIALIIEKAHITIIVEDQAYDYDGNDHASKVTDGAYTVSVNNGQILADLVALSIANGTYTEAGVYRAVILATHGYDTDNYVITVDNGDLTIRKVDNAWTEELNVSQDIVYDKSPIVSGTDFFSDAKFGDGDIKYTFYEKIGETWVMMTDTLPTKAGEYAVEASVPATNNYNALASARVLFSIRKATLTVGDVTFEDATVVYDGREHSIYVTADEIAALFRITYEGNANVNAGSYSVIAKLALLDADNYLLEGVDTLEATLTIEAVRVTVTANDNTSMYGNAIGELVYEILFGGDADDADFYANEFGAITLHTTATSQSNVGAYPITVGYTANGNYAVTVNEGTYTITRFVGNAIDLSADDVNYLMDLVCAATALRGQGTITFSFATGEAGPFDVTPKNVGTYYVKATVVGTENYEGAEAIVAFEITKATLSAITNVTYNGDTATWSAVVTTTDGKTVDCDVTYLVNGSNLTLPTFTATNTGNFSVTAQAVDTANYNDSALVWLATVYSVNFADKVENHDRQQSLADLSDAVYATQFRFAGESVTMPAGTPTVVGYTFSGWKLDESDYGFNEAVTASITLFADWTINPYTLTLYNEVVTGSQIVNGIFQEGAITKELYATYTLYYGDPFNLTGVTAPTKASDEVYTYLFAYWADAIRGNEVDSTIYVYDDLSLYAVYGSTARQYTVTYMVSIDGSAYAQHAVVTLPYGSELVSLDRVSWFVGDVWYRDADREIAAPSIVPAENVTLYGAYVFDIGAGDVNADGKINTDDIILYRQWIVGGYNIEFVAPGDEWSVATSNGFDPENTRYFVARVDDTNKDESGDIRDITTIRMALAGGYGYTYVNGRNSLAGVTGYGIVFVMDTISGVSTAEGLLAAVSGNPDEDLYIKLTADVTLDRVLTLNNGKNVTVNLNGYTLTMGPANYNNYVASVKNGTLTIEGAGTVIVPGAYGFGTASDTDTGHIVINGGTFVGENALYLFGCYNGSITINGGDFTALYSVLTAFSDDGYGNAMHGAATVNGGSFEVTDTDTYYRSFLFLGDVAVNGAATYYVHTAENLAIALQNGGDVVVVTDVLVDDTALEYIAYYVGVSTLTVPRGKVVTLDLNGHTISGEKACEGSYAMIQNNGTLTVSDSVGGGKISFKDTGFGDPTFEWGAYTILNNATLVINGVTIENLSEQNKDSEDCKHMFSAIDQAGGSTVVNGGIISTPYYRSIRVRNGALTVSDGTFDGQIWLQPSASSVIALSITGGEFSPNWMDGSSVYVENSLGTTTCEITGGFFHTKVGSAAPASLVGIIGGGTFTQSAKDNTNAALFNENYTFVDNGDQTYTLVAKAAE